MVINKLKTEKARITRVNSVGKMLSETDRAYIAGLIDADGGIMALIEHHREKRYRFRVRIEMKLTQKNPYILHWLKSRIMIGKVRQNRTTFDWLTRDQKEIFDLLKILSPFLKIKKEQAIIALKIISYSIKSKKDLLYVARLADSLSVKNPRSRGRRKNFSTMVEDSISPND